MSAARIAPSGGVYWSRINVSPLFAGGKYAGYLVVHNKPLRQ